MTPKERLNIILNTLDISPLDYEDIIEGLLGKYIPTEFRAVKRKRKWVISCYKPIPSKNGKLIWKYDTDLWPYVKYNTPEEAWKDFRFQGEPKLGSLHNKEVILPP